MGLDTRINSVFCIGDSMTLSELRQLPTTIGTGPNGPRVHESCLRSYQVLKMVRTMMENCEDRNKSPFVECLLYIIADAMDAPHVTKEINEP